MTKRGGKRSGAGRKKGTTTIAKTIQRQQETLIAQDKEAGRLKLQALVFAELTPLVQAQISNAKGIKYLVTRQKKTGKFIRVTEAMAKVKQALKDDEEIIEVWEKDPSVQAFTDLMNRAIDKPAEPVQEIKLTGEVTIIARLHAARARLATRQ